MEKVLIADEEVRLLLSTVPEDETHKVPFWPSFYTLPNKLRDSSYLVPSAVCIGPHHSKNEGLQASCNEWKITYMDDILSRTSCPKKEVMESCVRAVFNSLTKVKACYASTSAFDGYTDVQIAQMMFTDACYILGFMLDTLEHEKNPRCQRLKVVQTVMHDLVLLENQIPLFILNDVFQRTILEFMPDTSLVGLLSPILYSNNLFEAKIDIESISIDTTPHILGLLHQCYKPPQVDHIAEHPPSLSRNPRIKSALVLNRKGVNFCPNKDATWVMGMEVTFPSFWFWNKPALRMPVLHVYHRTDLVLKSLIAYEHSHAAVPKYITSYLYAMSMLVETEADVALLVKSQVVVNKLGPLMAVKNRIVTIADRHTSGVNSFYEEQLNTLNNYCSGVECSMRRAPLTMIALLAGFILFALYWRQHFDKSI